MDIKRGIDVAVNAVVADFRKRSRRISTNDEIAQVATISANGDREIGNMLAQAMARVGSKRRDHGGGGQIARDRARSRGGYAIRSRLHQPPFVTDAEKMIAELENPYIVIARRHRCPDRRSGDLGGLWNQA